MDWEGTKNKNNNNTNKRAYTLMHTPSFRHHRAAGGRGQHGRLRYLPGRLMMKPNDEDDVRTRDRMWDDVPLNRTIQTSGQVCKCLNGCLKGRAVGDVWAVQPQEGVRLRVCV